MSSQISQLFPRQNSPFAADPNRSPMTVGEIVAMLLQFDPNAMVVLSDPISGDFDLTGDVGSTLSTDNFVNDIRPILRLRRRS